MGYVYYYRNTNTDANPILATGVQLKVGLSILTVISRATPYVYDWNGDGLNDLLCGCGTGQVYYFRNTGTAQAPTYATGTFLQAGGVDLNLGFRSVVRMFDWDGDGKNDLVGSAREGVYWCKNTGTPSAPSLQAKVALTAPVATGGLAPIKTDTNPTSTSVRMRLDLADWNNDGVMDMLVGNSVGTVSYLRGYRFMSSIIGRDLCGGYILQWNSASYLKYNVWAGHTLVGMTNCVATDVPSGGLTTCWTNACGDTQQFYRLQIAE
jgi:FG-GAP-like repeat